MKFNKGSKRMQREKRALPDDLFYDRNDFWIKAAE